MLVAVAALFFSLHSVQSPVWAQQLPDNCKLPLRKLPYPFGNAFSYASDIDEQSPSFGMAFHRLMNHELGLPIGDSVWVQGNVPYLSYFYRSLTGKLNDTETITTGLPAYFELLRHWYRGNIDHFHSWQSDDLPRLAHRFSPPLKLSNTITKHRLMPLSTGYGFEAPPLFRITVTAPLSPKTVVTLLDSFGNRIDLPLNRASSYRPAKEGSGLVDKKKNPAGTVFYEWRLSGDVDLQSPYFKNWWSIKKFDTVRRRVARMFASSKLLEVSHFDALQIRHACERDCATQLLRVEFDAFSRQTVASQMKFLDMHNIRPNVLTSHGGWTMAQNFGNSPEIGHTKKDPDFINFSWVDLEARIRGNIRNSTGYYSDLLARSGVRAIWPWDPPAASLKDSFPEPKLLAGTSMWQLPRHYQINIDRNKGDPAVTAVRGHVPDLTEQEAILIRSYDCGTRCTSQADAVALQTLISLVFMRRETELEHLWYGHFGGDRARKWRKAPHKPTYRRQTKDALTALAAAYYGWDKDFPKWHRPWVVSTSVWANYWLARHQIKRHVTIDQEASKIDIRRSLDRATGQMFPSKRWPEASLHGLTFYVLDASKAKVTVDGMPITSLIRNQADECGRQSVMIVDSHTQTSILSKLPPKANGDLAVLAGTATFVPDFDGGEDPHTGKLLAMPDKNGILELTFKPFHMSAFNTSYFLFDIDLEQASSSLADVDFEFVLGTERGDFRIVNEGSTLATKSGVATLEVPATALAAGYPVIVPIWAANWTGLSKCTAGTNWGGCDLPLGRINSLNIRVKFKADRRQRPVHIKRVALLRPDPMIVNRVQAFRVVGGRVLTKATQGVAGITVTLLNQSIGRAVSTKTDKFGTYRFTGVADNSIVSITNKHPGRGAPCRPAGVELFVVEHDTLELVTDLATDCHQ